MAVRFVHAEPGSVGARVAARVAWLSRTRSVLVVSCRLPAAQLRAELAAAGADLAHVFILDARGHGIPRPAQDPEHEAAVPGPAMLELIAKRAQQVIRAKAERAVTILVDDVASFALHNPAEALVEVLQYAAAIRSAANEQEYVVTGAEPPQLLRKARETVREEFDLLPSGELWPRGGAPGRGASAG